MTELEADFSARRRPRTPRPPRADAGLAAERRRIGRELHQGILQDLTVAGFRLKALENGASGADRAGISAFAEWLRTRQAALRRFVTTLEGPDANLRPNGYDLLVERLKDLDCRLSCDRRLPTGPFDPVVARAMLEVTGQVAELLARMGNARAVAVRLVRAAGPRLRLAHDGERLAEHPKLLARVRGFAGRGGAALTIKAGASGEILLLDWTG